MSRLINTIKNNADMSVLLFTLILTLIRLLASTGLGLSADEAHYALYGYFLDLSYFDHPPLVGWLQALMQQLSDSDLAMRVWPLLFAALTGWHLYAFSNELFPENGKRTGLIAFLLFQGGIVYQFLSMGLVPDTILILLSLLVFRVLWRVMKSNAMSGWLLLGVLFGLAGLAKYTAIVLVFTPVLIILFEKRYDLLKQPGLWLAVLIALIVISPVIYWNARHDWISIAYQFHHGTGSGGWSFLNFIKSQLGQFIAYTPLIYIVGITAIIYAWKHREDFVARYSLYCVLPMLVVFAWNGGYALTLPHWTAAAWLLLLPLTSQWLIKVWSGQIVVRAVAYFSISYSIILILFFYSELIYPWRPPLVPQAMNSLAGEFYGWHGAAQKAQQLQQHYSEQERGEKVQLFIGSWTLASRVAWYIKPEPVMVADNRFDQFDLWYGAPQNGASGIFIEWSLFPFPPRVSQQAGGFNQCEPIDHYDVEFNQRVLTRFKYYYCQGYHQYAEQ